MKYCINCGKPLEDGYKFCINCGARQPELEESPVKSAEEPQVNDAKPALDLNRLESVEIIHKSRWQKGASLLFEGAEIAKDPESGMQYARNRFRNLSEKKISGFAVTVYCKGEEGANADAEEAFAYVNKFVNPGEITGPDDPVALPEGKICDIEVTINTVLFEDGSKEEVFGETVEGPVLQALSTQYGDRRALEEFRAETSQKAAFYSNKTEDLWRCYCGAVNTIEKERCVACGAERDLQLSLTDEAVLVERAEQRLAKEAECRKEMEEAAALRRAKKRRAFLKAGIIGGSVLVLALAAVLTFMVFIPNSKYQTALEKMEAKDYVAAIAGFEGLGDYKDAALKVEECKELQLREAYDAAVTLMENKDYDAAVAAFTDLGSYADSRDRIDECRERETRDRYDSALKLFDAGKYEEAEKAFADLGDYENSELMANESLYQIGKEFFETEEYDKARAVFEELGRYANSEDMVTECIYQEGVKYWERGDYDKSNECFEQIINYRDSRLLIHAHEYTESIEKEPTCTEKGIKKLTCSCGSKKTEDIAPLGHSYVSEEIVKQPTCTEKGEKHLLCKCGEYTSEAVPALGHSYATETITTPATCTKSGVKTKTCRCGASITEEIPLTGHQYVKEVVHEATCMDKGTVHNICKNCGDLIVEEIPKTQHKYIWIDCELPYQCEYCGEEKSSKPAGHTTKRGTCENCGMYIRNGVVYADYDEYVNSL